MTTSNRFRFEAEVRLIRWGESSAAGRTITLELPPDAGDGHPFKGFPTGHNHGQRFRMHFDAIADDEQVSPAGTDKPQHQERTTVGGAGHGQQTATPTPAGEQQRQRYAAMSPAEQAVTRAAMLPGDVRFRAWVPEQWGITAQFRVVDGDMAADFIRERCCDGKSRKLIAEVPEYLDRFQKMETAFKIDVGEMAAPR